jgi:hypothetical protein
MGHSSETFLELRSRRRMEKQVRCDRIRCDRLLRAHDLELDEDSIPWILKHIDNFVSQSRGNESIGALYLWPHDINGHDDEVWDKVGQAIGNLQALERLHICNSHYPDDDEEVPIPDWEKLALILSHVRQKITLVVTPGYDEDEDHGSAWRAEESRSFARAIHGHPTITRFEGGEDFPYETMDSLYSALATLPALKSIRLGTPKVRQADETNLANPESLTELLRVPSLRCVWFDGFSFTRALCQATANALMKDTAITKLQFWDCSFSAEESATIMAKGFTRNTSVIYISVQFSNGRALSVALAAALPSNSTLRDLSLLCGSFSADVHLSPVFLALGKNRGLKALKVDVSEAIDGSLCTAIQDGLGINETLESLELRCVPLCDDNADLWCRAFSFLRTNKAVKSLVVDMQNGFTESCLSAFRIDIVTMLQENTSLESLFFRRSWNGIKIKAEEYFVLIAALQRNTTLKTLSMRIYHQNHLAHPCRKIRLTDDEDKQMAALLKKNYAMERLPEIDMENEVGDVCAILRLNEAGRRYLVQDGFSVSKGVEVLSRVNSNDISCVFLHLLENPRLCDRRAVEMVTADESNGESTNPNASNGGGMREQASAHRGNESRGRLA